MLKEEITRYIFLSSKPQKADLAIILGNRFSEPAMVARHLYKNKLVPKILISGGKNRVTGENEAVRLYSELMKFGVEQKDIILEDKSMNTLENVLFSKKVIEEELGFNNIKKIIAIVKHYHSRRALMTFKRHFPKYIEVVPATYVVEGFTENNWYEHPVDRGKVFSEVKKIKKYLEKGDIEEL